VELKTKVDTKHAQAIFAEAVKDVKSGDQVPLPKGSQVKGTITQVEGASKGHPGSQIDVVLDSVVPKNGQPAPNHFAIYAVSAKIEAQPGDIYSSGGTGRMAASAGIAGQVSAPGHEEFSPQSTGVFGYTDVELHPLVKMTPPTATFNCAKGNFVLESGTKLVLESLGQ
jgi:hypothetical protein